MDPTTPRPPESPLRLVAFGVGCLVALFGFAVGAVCIYSALFPGGSGEWEGVGQVAALVLQIPAGIAVLGLAFFQAKGRRRSVLLAGAALILLMPVASVVLRHVRSAWYRHELERSLHRR